ncbi:hypothetical protein M2347_002322 [Chryseobacterium sp. H1D6B]|uniref:hypothetical protein n=1 Tax=Chryseobacterium sp. H1D6B TaxID=2940588 RepID=UPI0015C71808|nr:hypothetical protein [Chryseobacterium sp. H1D6B]MDH6252595.1 hypothetical protein [Chryseobacterium sp. H1D6B]
MKQFFLFILTMIFYNHSYCQIKVNLQINQKTGNAYISLYNETSDYIAIPLDTKSLRPYYEDICIDMSEYQSPYPTLGFNLIVTDLITKQNLGAFSTSGNLNGEDVKKYSEINLSKKDTLKQKIIKWQSENKISSYETAYINYYLMKSFIFLKPRERIQFICHFDLHNITNEKYIYSFFPTEDNKKYSVNLYFDINECIYKYLTQYQKKKLGNYKLFIGKIESNTIELNN